MDSCANCLACSALSKASRRDVSAASTACLTTLMAAPAAGRSSLLSLPKPFKASVSKPVLPRYLALAISSSFMLALAAKSDCACGIKWLKSVM